MFRVSIFAVLGRRSSQDEQAPVPSGEPGRTTDPNDLTTFGSLGIADDLVSVLAREGVRAPFPIQAQTIPAALDGRDICGRARTGAGKTLAFGLPLIERTTKAKRRHPRSLVLVPTRELAVQVADALAPLAAARGLWLAPIYGGVSMARQIRMLVQGLDIVIATPGRLNDLIERGEVSMAAVRFVVLDEADQMADMGFLPQVRRILDLVEERPQTLLFSATLDGAVGELVQRYQRDPLHHEVASEDEDTSAMEQRFVVVDTAELVDATVVLCAPVRRSLVFVSTTHGADRLVTSLERAGIKAAAIHGRLSQAKRERTLTQFRAGTVKVLVATNVAARGIHVDDVDLVVHFDPPEDSKVYLHRSGRTARAGAGGLVVTLVQPQYAPMMTRLQREVGVDHELIQMRPDDPRLKDLAAWQPPAARYAPEAGTYNMNPARRKAGGGGPRRTPQPFAHQQPKGSVKSAGGSARGARAPSRPGGRSTHGSRGSLLR